MFRPAVDPNASSPISLNDMVSKNALRIADLISKLEQSNAELKRLRSRATRVNSKTRNTRSATRPRAPKSPSSRTRNKSVRSPGRTLLAPTQTPSPTSVIFNGGIDFEALTVPFKSTASPAHISGHWSRAEIARFEQAATQFGATSWDAITAAVGSRSEKQVRAFAARQRRRETKNIASEFAALDIPINSPQFGRASQNAITPGSIEEALLGGMNAVAAQKVPLLSEQKQHPSAAITGSLDGLSSSSSNPLMGSEFDVCTSAFEYATGGGVLDGSSRGSSIEDMGEFTFDETLFQALDKRASGTAKVDPHNGAFDWNGFPVAEGHDMPVDLTENFLLLEHI